MDKTELKTLRKAYDDATHKALVARLSLAEAIREAKAEGWSQVDIVHVTGYTREQVRRIVAGRTR